MAVVRDEVQAAETAELVLVRWGEVKRVVVVVERATMTTIASQEVMILA